MDDTDDVDVWKAAGLLDDLARDVDDRIELLRYLAAQGLSTAEMVQAKEVEGLQAAASDRLMLEGPLSARDLAERSGLGLDRIVESYRLLGTPVTDPDLRRHDESELRLLELVGAAGEVFTEGIGDEIFRSIGSALGAIAETSVSAFVGSVEDDLEQQSERAWAETVTDVTGLGIELGTLLGPLLRHHLYEAIAQQRASMRTSPSRRHSSVTVGFVDLVGFTTASEAMTADELLTFIRDFHARTYDIATRGGGRVVKHIGDEIMFRADSAAHGCEIALALVEAFADADSLPRGGLAHGFAVARHGDLYGPVVNLAARLADIAVSGEVLASTEVADAVDATGFAFEPAGRRQLKGFAEPVSVLSLARS